MSERQEANFENRTYYFHIVEKAETELRINMYGCNYTFLNKNGVWHNSPANSQNMIQPLITSVVLAVGML